MGKKLPARNISESDAISPMLLAASTLPTQPAMANLNSAHLDHADLSGADLEGTAITTPDTT